jgi:hypothetical protein
LPPAHAQAPQQGRAAAPPAPAPAPAAAPRSNAAVGQHLPSASLNLSRVVVPPIAIATPAGVATATLALGGTLKARQTGSKNPVSVSNKGVSASAGGASVDSGGTVSASKELQGISSSVSVDLKGGAPQVKIGSVGTFSSQEISKELTPTGGIKLTYKCTSKEVKTTRNGVEISGSVSYTLTVVVQPAPKAPWYQRAAQALGDGLRSVGDWISQNRREILIGVGAAAVVVAGALIIAGTGGMAAPALAPALAS